MRGLEPTYAYVLMPARNPTGSLWGYLPTAGS
jgi:hypothetical protein